MKHEKQILAGSLILMALGLFLAGAVFESPAGLDTSPPGYAVHFRLDVWQDNELTRTCLCWRYERYAEKIQPYAEGDLMLEPIVFEYGQAVEISGVRP